ncbi:hypothetical protein ABTX85_11265 [Streptomyces sp. NPDC096097]|uniref:hypothetical protein n=1 Tax=Streptomyces sp. NPDC096097 TaxID=3155546 RepID=UPI003327C529
MLTPTVAELPVSLGTYGRGAEQADGPGRLEHLFHRSPFTAAFDVAGMPVMSVPLACEPATGLCRRAPAGAGASRGGARV